MVWLKIYRELVKIWQEQHSYHQSQRKRQNTKQQRFCKKLFYEPAAIRAYNFFSNQLLCAVGRFCSGKIDEVDACNHQNKRGNRAK